MSLQENIFEDADLLTDALAIRIQTDLANAIAKKGAATLAVSGGNTPKPLFGKLAANGDIQWSKVTVMLVDERWVDDQSPASNQTLVKAHLLQNHAAKANYLSVKDVSLAITDAVADIAASVRPYLPLDVVILGMGNDAHTASLFPCSKELADGLNLQNDAVMLATTPTTAPHERISLTLKSIVGASSVYLHITGAEKRHVLAEAIASGNAMEKPIAAVAKHADLQLMWAP